MDYIREIQSYHCDRASAVTLGKFDGLHRGHQKLIREICEKKEKFQVKNIMTFHVALKRLNLMKN